MKYGVYIHLHHKTSWGIMPPLTSEHLEQAQTAPISPKDPHMAGWEHPVHQIAPLWLWTIMVGCTRHWRSAGIYHGALLHLHVSLILHVIPKTWITRRDREEYCFLSQVNTLNKHKEVGLHVSIPRARFPTWLVVNTRFTHYDWVDHNGRMHKNTKVTHCSNIPALGNLSFEVPWD